MTNDLNREIAELLGWTSVKQFKDGCWGYPPDAPLHEIDADDKVTLKAWWHEVPDFTGSLDALRPVLLTLEDKELIEWDARLRYVGGETSQFIRRTTDPKEWAKYLRDVLKERQDGAE